MGSSVGCSVEVQGVDVRVWWVVGAVAGVKGCVCARAGVACGARCVGCPKAQSRVVDSIFVFDAFTCHHRMMWWVDTYPWVTAMPVYSYIHWRNMDSSSH